MNKKENTTYLPTAFTIFGATGDLSRRKLLPAIFHLFDHGLLPEHIIFFGVSIDDISDIEFREVITASVQEFNHGQTDITKLNEFTELFTYYNGDFTKPKTFTDLKKRLQENDEHCQLPHQAVFYLATPPAFFIPIVEQLHTANLTGPCPEYNTKAKIVIEKPFGHDTESAKKLNDAVLQYAEEEQIYRMDHYLGKETVQNILLFRFTNPVINDSWNPASIERVDILASESIGVEKRAAYYDATGALRDMIQSHCLTLLTLAMMDEPLSLSSGDIHERKQAILKTLSIAGTHSTHDVDMKITALRAQHNGYRDIDGVANNSTTETYAATKLESSHPHWKNVPIYIQTGKRLGQKETSITIHFAPCKSNICKTQGIKTEPNVLTIRVQPEEGISLRLYAKHPGFSIRTEQVNMEFNYSDTFAVEQPSPYERLIHDVIIGDQSLFPSTIEIMEQWRIIQPLLDAWYGPDNSSHPLYLYPTDSLGPDEVKQFLQK